MNLFGLIAILIRRSLDKACPEQNTHLAPFCILSYYFYMFTVIPLQDTIYFKWSRMWLIIWLICCIL